MPYNSDTSEALKTFDSTLKCYFDIHLISHTHDNPLFAASEKAERQLKLVGANAVTNENQIALLLEFSATPFCVLQLRD